MTGKRIKQINNLVITYSEEFQHAVWTLDGRCWEDRMTLEQAEDFCRNTKDFVATRQSGSEKPALDNVIKSCEEMSKNNEVKSECNEYYKTSDGFFDYYVNRKTGEKKFKLNENDVEVESNLDDFFRSREER